MTAPARFADSVYDRIGSYLPADQRVTYYRYVAHLRTLEPGDSLLVLAEGMALFACISRQVPEALATEREKLLADFARLCVKHETTTTAATADVRMMFSAHQKLLEQNMAAWQNKEQQAAQSLDETAKRFEGSASDCTARLKQVCSEILLATAQHRGAAAEAQKWVSQVSLETRVWPYLACAACGALIALLVAYFLPLLRSMGN